MVRQMLKSVIDEKSEVLLMTLEGYNWMYTLVSAVVGGDLFVEQEVAVPARPLF